MTKLVLLLIVLSAVATSAEVWPRLFQWNATGPAIWMTEKQFRARRATMPPWPTGFQDITDTPNLSRGVAKTSTIPVAPTKQHIVVPLLNFLSASNIASYVSHFENYHTRYYTTETGKQSSEWARDKFVEFANNNPDVEVELFEHSWAQPSVICRWKGVSDERVILGSHIDSVAGSASSRAPGADDDASAVAELLEIFRVLSAHGEAAGFKPHHTIEFHAYAAEEVGLRGAREIAAKYKSDGIVIKAMNQAEMSGYVGNSRTITILDDSYNNLQLTRFHEQDALEYSGLNVRFNRCNYGCSDHYAWAEAGYPTTCNAEAGPSGGANPYMHTANDLLTHLDPEYILAFAKTNLGYVVELSMHTD